MKTRTALTLVAMVVLATADSFAQCAMCVSALEQNVELAGGFNRGILFLLAMPYLVFSAIGVGYVVRRWRRGRSQPQARELHSALG